MSSILVFIDLKNSGMSCHSPDSAFATVCFTSPRIMSVSGFVESISWRSFWRIFGICEGTWIPF